MIVSPRSRVEIFQKMETQPPRILCVVVCFFYLLFDKQKNLFIPQLPLFFGGGKVGCHNHPPISHHPISQSDRPKTFDELRHIQNSVPRGVEGPEGPPMSRWPRRASWEATGKAMVDRLIVPKHKALLFLGGGWWHWGGVGALRFPMNFFVVEGKNSDGYCCGCSVPTICWSKAPPKRSF